METSFKTSVLILVISLILIGCGGNTSSKPETNLESENGINKLMFRLATTTPDDHSTSMGAYKFKEILEEKSNGQIEVEVFTNLQLGSLREQMEAAQLGTLEMSLSLVSTATSFVEDLSVLEYPYLWPDEDSLWKVMDGEVGRQAAELVREAGFEGLGFWAGGYKVFTNKGKPLLNPSDFNGLKVRVIPSKTLLETFSTWGANPVPVDFAEVYNALQMGTVDAQENPVETIFTQKYFEVQDHLTVSNHGYQFHFMLANKEWFDSLEPEIQNLIKEADDEARKYAREINMQSVENTLGQLESLGLEIHELPVENKNAFIESSLPVHQKLSDTEIKKELLESVYQALGN